MNNYKEKDSFFKKVSINTVNTLGSLQSSNALKEKFNSKFEKGKVWDQYFPHNNLNTIIDKYNDEQVKKIISGKQDKPKNKNDEYVIKEPKNGRIKGNQAKRASSTSNKRIISIPNGAAAISNSRSQEFQSEENLKNAKKKKSTILQHEQRTMNKMQEQQDENDFSTPSRVDSLTNLDEEDIDYKFIQPVENAYYYNCLQNSIIPELLDLKLFYNQENIINNNKEQEKQQIEVFEEPKMKKIIEKIASNLKKKQQTLNYKTSQTMPGCRSQQFYKKEKKYKHYISKLVVKQNKLELLVCNLKDSKPDICIYPLTYDFGNVTPSTNIIQEKSTGRYFIYDNNNKILCFSRIPVKNSDRDDKSRPLIEMFLEDENPRIDPTLYIKEYGNFSCLMVIGGYRKSKNTGNTSIFLTDSIKVFKLEKKIVSTNYILEITLSQKRMNPIIVKHKEQIKQDDQIAINNDDQEDGQDELLLFLGGNNIAECKRLNNLATTQSLLNANQTCEILNCDVLYEYMRRGMRKNFKIQQTIRLKYKESFEEVKNISENLLRGCVIQKKNIKSQEPRRFLFCDKKSQILEIKYINVKEKLIELLDGEFAIKGNSTVFPSMAQIYDQKLYYLTENEKKVRTIPMSYFNQQNENLTTINNRLLQSRTIAYVNEMQSPQLKKKAMLKLQTMGVLFSSPEQQKKYLSIFIKVGMCGSFGLSICLFTIFKLQHKIIYHPSIPGFPKSPQDNPIGYRNPQEQGIPYEDIELLTSDKIKIRGWFLKQKINYQLCPTLIFFHENAGNIGDRLEYLKYYYNLVGVNILMMAYRGYSDSDSCKINEQGIKRDVDSIMDYIFSREDIDRTKIFTHGRSLGGATSTYGIVYHQNKKEPQPYSVKGAILENTFTSIADVGKSMLPEIIMKFAGIVLKNKWETINIIDQVKCPLLFIKAMKDELVPPEQMTQLYNKSKPEKKIEIPVQQGDHNDNWTFQKQQYFDYIRNFIYN